MLETHYCYHFDFSNLGAMLIGFSRCVLHLKIRLHSFLYFNEHLCVRVFLYVLHFLSVCQIQNEHTMCIALQYCNASAHLHQHILHCTLTFYYIISLFFVHCSVRHTLNNRGKCQCSTTNEKHSQREEDFWRVYCVSLYMCMSDSLAI